MLVVHIAMRREFRLAPGLVRGVAAGDLTRAGVVADHLRWLLDLLHHHHEGEDRLLWPLLLERVPAEVAPTVELMQNQHEAIGATVTEAGTRCEAWRAAADATGRDALADALDRLHTALDEHLALEEREVLPLAAATLSPQEWGRLGEEGMAGVPPRQRPLVLGMFMYEGDPATIKGMLAHAPTLPRLALPVVGPRVFARYARKVHGTPVP